MKELVYSIEPLGALLVVSKVEEGYLLELTVKGQPLFGETYHFTSEAEAIAAAEQLNKDFCDGKTNDTRPFPYARNEADD